MYAPSGEVISINDSWTELTGYTHEEIPTIAQWTEKAYQEHKESARAVIDRLYLTQTKVNEGEFTIHTKNGEYRIWNFSSAPLGTLPDGRRLVISIGMDITERKIAEGKLRYAALHDALTGLPNRSLLIEHLENALTQAKQQQDYDFAVLFIDLDRFKVVNDSLGHLVGDQLLQVIARILEKCVHPTNLVARFGGDEFVILVNRIKSWQEVTTIAERMIGELQSPLKIEEKYFFVSASIGIAFPSRQDKNAFDLLRNADLAMYRAKERGKSRYAIYDPVMHRHVSRLLELETNLRIALEKDQFRIYYQPIVSLATIELVCFEALVRWYHPTKGLISPLEFVPIAEETGLIIVLGEWILWESCRQMKAWIEKYPKAAKIRVSVNLSGRQLEQHNFIETVNNILYEHNFDGSNLKVEITESILMKNKELAITILSEMHKRNIQVSIDDFGTGYSSLSYLHYLPVNTLKIDRTFVSRMNDDGENFEIVEAIITLAHHLHMDVIAEGVETESHLEQVKNLGCEYGQGYLFSKPLDAEAAGKLLENL